jgi:2',3'-cyclic-nucleotide 2'-phosphodiesterase (5'-nucleotidase family)
VTRRLLLWLLLGLAPLRGQSLTILDSNDLHAHLESFARLATAVRQEKMGLTWLPV